MASRFENGKIVATLPVFIEENKIRDVRLIVDRESPEGWFRMPGRRDSEVKLIPVRAVLFGHVRTAAYADAIDKWWEEDYEVGIASEDATPITLFQK